MSVHRVLLRRGSNKHPSAIGGRFGFLRRLILAVAGFHSDADVARRLIGARERYELFAESPCAANRAYRSMTLVAFLARALEACISVDRRRHFNSMRLHFFFQPKARGDEFNATSTNIARSIFIRKRSVQDAELFRATPLSARFFAHLTEPVRDLPRLESEGFSVLRVLRRRRAVSSGVRVVVEIFVIVVVPDVFNHPSYPTVIGICRHCAQYIEFARSTVRRFRRHRSRRSRAKHLRFEAQQRVLALQLLKHLILQVDARTNASQLVVDIHIFKQTLADAFARARAEMTPLADATVDRRRSV